MPWIEKHRPRIFEEIKGQDQAIAKIREFFRNFGKEKKSLILHGPPGVGKTTLAYALANETNSEVVELNASDLRNREKLQEILKPAIEQKSLTKEGKIILIDEIDGISETDRGCIEELSELIVSTPYPMIITSNNIWERKLNSIRNKSEMIKLREIDYKTIKDVLINVLRKENKFIDSKILTSIAVKSKGDLRAAINDLQAISKLEDPSSVKFDERNKETDIFNSLRQIFKNKPTNELLNVFDSVNMNIDEIMLWIEENIPAEYKGAELARAYDALSKTDVFKGRIYKQQYWRFLIYENILLSYGISASKDPNRIQKNSFTSYKKPTRILKIWLNNQRTEKKKSIAQKYSKYVHVGEKRAMKEFSLVKTILRANQKIQEELKLTQDEVAYLNAE